jgi:hypothetical protein
MERAVSLDNSVGIEIMGMELSALIVLLRWVPIA